MNKFTIILPCYNCEDFIEQNVEILIQHLNQGKLNQFEIIAVDDGSTDQTLAKLKIIKKKHPDKFHYVSYKPNRGKGFAIKQGISQANTNYIIFTDADLAYALYDISNIIRKLLDGNYDIVIASKYIKGSTIITNPDIALFVTIRSIVSRLLNIAIRFLFNLSYKDTQAGLKGFTKNVAQKFIQTQKCNRFAFDVELLYYAKKSKLRVLELPATVKILTKESTVSFKAGIYFLYELLKLRLNSIHFLFGKKKVAKKNR